MLGITTVVTTIETNVENIYGASDNVHIYTSYKPTMLISRILERSFGIYVGRFWNILGFRQLSSNRNDLCYSGIIFGVMLVGDWKMISLMKARTSHYAPILQNHVPEGH
jgi:hypothetical protein